MIKKEKIYIIEDDQTIVSLLKSHLKENYDVYTVLNFRDIKNEVESLSPDIILMDIGLPYFNGFYWTSEIRKSLTVPIIFISSSNDDMDAVMALNMGGDDFISKPFSLMILEAKIAALLRRSHQFASDDLQIGGYHLSLDGIFKNQEETVTLSPTETKILAFLISRKEQVVSKEDILQRLWENDNFIDHNTLNVNMTRLRKKLQTIGFNRIHTVRGVGYLIK
ncbi:hypothetical protein HMPREF9318_00394 [Streptococcus urinalis FB127-CNA-2]|uniref:Transcriptional regulatory protein, C-terminal domain protein n=1 Tax=Streptococcus urinalis 2285-97 TaxID=764291 RepID=G5KFY6_9STRE|nr:response regulator transcription factor [Streptococcus urinalis]EHJ57368.1 transcriptional regulatory protein, C-terminal domain protein [Streptococcus urinalis 2285-97]EKS22196.1 hypothetical protein HMPREF9318_00394 [Streptococcus urinalis FB127-CNA-2]VEF32008.1 two-component response regulator [Streptococcus urinalis]